MSKHDWQVIEGNGGQLYLYIFPVGSNVPVAGGYDFEHLDSDDFAATIERIEADDFDLAETRDWSGMFEDAAAEYDGFPEDMTGYESIAMCEDGVRTIKTERMGQAGQLALRNLIAEEVYRTTYPDVDSKEFHAAAVQEIIDWLKDGDPISGQKITDLADEFFAYTDNN